MILGIRVCYFAPVKVIISCFHGVTFYCYYFLFSKDNFLARWIWMSKHKVCWRCYIDYFLCPPENFASSKLPLSELPPKEAKVVVCGGGMVGTSVLYHLAMLGWGKDVVMLEQGRSTAFIFIVHQIIYIIFFLYKELKLQIKDIPLWRH